MSKNTNYSYKTIYTKSFSKSFKNEIRNRRDNLQLSTAQISRFVSEIYENINIVVDFPYTNENIADKYNMLTDTRAITLDKRYAIFYRINEDKHTITFGSLFNNREINILF